MEKRKTQGSGSLGRGRFKVVFEMITTLRPSSHSGTLVVFGFYSSTDATVSE